MTAARQDRGGLVTNKMVDRIFDAANHWDSEERWDRLHAALSAVAPDIAAQARRECAEELRAELDRISEKSRPGNPKMRDLEHVSLMARKVVAGQLSALVTRWSGSGRTPADEG